MPEVSPPRREAAEPAASFTRRPLAIKRKRLIVIGIGALISLVLPLAAAWLFPGNRDWAQIFAAPGFIVVILIWGQHGPAPDWALAVILAVNAIAYGLVVLAAARIGEVLRPKHHPN